MVLACSVEENTTWFLRSTLVSVDVRQTIMKNQKKSCKGIKIVVQKKECPRTMYCISDHTIQLPWNVNLGGRFGGWCVV